MLTVKLNADGVEMILTGTLAQLISWAARNARHKNAVIETLVQTLAGMWHLMIITIDGSIAPNELPAGAIKLDDGNIKIDCSAQDLIDWMHKHPQFKNQVLTAITEAVDSGDLVVVGKKYRRTERDDIAKKNGYKFRIDYRNASQPVYIDSLDEIGRTVCVGLHTKYYMVVELWSRRVIGSGILKGCTKPLRIAS